MIEILYIVVDVVWVLEISTVIVSEVCNGSNAQAIKKSSLISFSVSKYWLKNALNFIDYLKVNRFLKKNKKNTYISYFL